MPDSLCFLPTPAPFLDMDILFLNFLNKLIYLFIIFWLHWVFVGMWAFSICSEQGLLFVAVRGLLIAVASLVAELGL